VQRGDVVAERFEILERAGAGGMGTVYRARDRHLGGAVALKVLDAAGGGDAVRFGREAQVLASIDHPAVVGYVAHGETPRGERWLAMEWVEGEDLAARLARGPLGVVDALACALRVADGLGAAHARGVVHRDVKPSNVLLVGGDPAQARIADFGIARSMRPEARGPTRTGSTLGTPHCMAPEQARGVRDLDARADVYALGALLFEALTGRPVFDAESAVAVLAMVLLDEPPSLADARPDVPADVAALVARLLAKDRRERPADGAATAALLAPLLDEARRAAARATRRLDAADAAASTIAQTDASARATPGSLGTEEQRLRCALVLGDGAGDVGTDATLPDDSARLGLGARDAAGRTVLETARAVVERHGGRLDLLTAEAGVAVIDGVGTPLDHAGRGARCALALAEAAPGLPIALVLGRAVGGPRTRIGDLVDRGVALLHAARSAERARDLAGAPRVDEALGALLAGRFEVAHDPAGARLVRERPAGTPAPAVRRASAPLVGRERELATLEATYADVRDEGAARAVLLVGAPGLGKSRLVDEAAARIGALAGDSGPLLRGACDPSTAGAPYAPLATALVGATPERTVAALVARHVSDAERARRVCAALNVLARGPRSDADDEALGEACDDPRLLADVVRAAFVDLLAGMATQGPTLVIVEDLQWGDAPSVGLLDAALRHLAGAPLLLIATARPEVDMLFPALWRGRPLVRMELAPLGAKAALRLARALDESARRGASGEEVRPARLSAAQLERIAARSDGNPFFLEQLLRAAWRAPDRADALPDTVVGIVQANLDSLDPRDRRTLRAASVVGDPFDRESLGPLCGAPAESAALGASLAALVEAEVVEPCADRAVGGGAAIAGPLRFRSALVRECVYASLTDEDRRLGHRLHAEWLIGRGSADAERLALHFGRGGVHLAAARWMQAAARAALDASDLGRADALAQQALAQLKRAARSEERPEHGADDRAEDDGAASEGELLWIRAEALRWRGDAAGAVTLAERAVAALPRGDARWFQAVGDACAAAARLGDAARVRAFAEAAIAQAPAGARGDEAAAARVVCLARAAAQLAAVGDAAGRDEALALAARDARTLGDAPLGARATLAAVRASRALAAGDLGAFLEGTARAVEDYERAGDVRNACNQRVRLGNALVDAGAPTEAEEMLRPAVAQASRLGLALVEAYAWQNLGHALAVQA
jgi:hypothetical protein